MHNDDSTDIFFSKFLSLVARMIINIYRLVRLHSMADQQVEVLDLITV